MRAAYLSEVEKMEIRENPIPEIAENEVLVRPKASGICGSDLHAYLGKHLFRKPPVILGHEMAGEVCRVGPGVTTLKVGDRVTVDPSISCGHCVYCRAGNENLCEDRRAPGKDGWIGTFADYFPIRADKAYRFSDKISYDKAALTEPLANCVHILSLVRDRERKAIAVIGCGTIGLLTILLAKRQGYQTIIGSDPLAFNRAVAEKVGATHTVDPLKEDIVSYIRDLTGGMGVDVSVVAAGAPGILDQASDITKKGGEIMLVAMMTEQSTLSSVKLLSRQQELRGSMLYNPVDFENALAVIEGGADLSALLTHTMKLEDVDQAMRMLKERKEDLIKITLHFD